MTASIEERKEALADEIIRFLDKYARTSAAFDPEVDRPEERFNGPDSALMWATAETLRLGGPVTLPWSDWSSGCYAPMGDMEGKAWHDQLLEEIGLIANAYASLGASTNLR